MDQLINIICSVFPEVRSRVRDAEGRMQGSGLTEFACATIEALSTDASKSTGLSYLRFILNELEMAKYESSLSRLQKHYVNPLIEMGRRGDA